MIIYKITNCVTKEHYIGQTVMSMGRRWSQHSTSKKITPLYRSFKKYGLDNFTIEVICSAIAPEYLNELEVYFIKLYNSEHPNGYNLTSGGDSAFSRSEETKRKQRNSMLGHVVSDETKRKISQTLTGRPGVRKGAHHTEQTKAKISQVQTGRKLSDATRRKQSESHRGINAKNAKQVMCVETGVIYHGATEAARELNLVQSSISAVCRGTRKQTGGLTFKFIA